MPVMGRFFERIMKNIKHFLRKILGSGLLTFEELMIILVVAENFLNHRPQIYVYDGSSEPEPFTPAHFLLVGHKVV